MCCLFYIEPQGEHVTGDSVLESLWVGATVGTWGLGVGAEKWGLLEGDLGMARGEGVTTQGYWA